MVKLTYRKRDRIADMNRSTIEVKKQHSNGDHQNEKTKLKMKSGIVRILKLINILIHLALFFGCWCVFFYDKGIDASLPFQCFSSLILYFVLLVLLDRIYNAFDVGLSRISELMYSNELSSVIASAVVYMLMTLEWLQLPNILFLLLLWGVQLGWNCLWAYVANYIFFFIHQPKRTVIVYRNKNDLHKLHQLTKYKNRFTVEKTVENPSNITQLLSEIEGYDVVFAVGLNATLRNGLAKHCVESGVQGYIEPKVGDIILTGAKVVQSFSIPILHVRPSSPPPEYLFAKRGMDILLSLVLIMLTWPIMVVVAIVIKAYDKGPVLYKQIRLTQNGREFEILKFRSMRVDAEKNGIAQLSTGEKDDRVTPVGRVIRACRIDELPQVFNILRGDMTIVGPRPERPEIAAVYEKTLPAFRLRLQVKAGLTGYAQVYGRYNTQPYDKLQMDLMYINRMSFAEDLRLILATVKILFLKESTQGVDNRTLTAMSADCEDEIKTA